MKIAKTMKSRRTWLRKNLDEVMLGFRKRAELVEKRRKEHLELVKQQRYERIAEKRKGGLPTVPVFTGVKTERFSGRGSHEE